MCALVCVYEMKSLVLACGTWVISQKYIV